MSLLLFAWLVSYLSAWGLFVYFGFLWSREVGSGQAAAAWFLVSALLAAVGLVVEYLSGDGGLCAIGGGGQTVKWTRPGNGSAWALGRGATRTS